jgi:hypothetical protein
MGQIFLVGTRIKIALTEIVRGQIHQYKSAVCAICVVEKELLESLLSSSKGWRKFTDNDLVGAGQIGTSDNKKLALRQTYQLKCILPRLIL